MILHKKYIPIIMLLVCFPTLAFAGAWTQKTGKLQVITGLGVYKASRFFDIQGKTHPQTPFYKEEWATYAEYGITDDWTAGGQIALARAYQSPQGKWNLGDSNIFVRRKLWQNETYVVSAQPYVVIPSPDKSYDQPKIGGDHYSVGLRLNGGHNFKLFNAWHYADLSAGYLHRAGTPKDQFVLDATVGYNITDSWQIIPQLFLTQSLSPIQSTGTGFTQSSADDYNATKLQLSVQYKLNENSAVQAGIFDTVAGKNTGVGQGANLNYIRNF